MRVKTYLSMNATPTDLFEFETEEEVREFDEIYMGDVRYFTNHEGKYYFVDAEDLDNDTRVALEDNHSLQTIPGFYIVLHNEQHVKAARKMLTEDTYTQGCIVRFGGVTQLLITHDVSYLQKAIEQKLNRIQEEERD